MKRETGSFLTCSSVVQVLMTVSSRRRRRPEEEQERVIEGPEEHEDDESFLCTESFVFCIPKTHKMILNQGPEVIKPRPRGSLSTE